jgi:hypothetical protein
MDLNSVTQIPQYAELVGNTSKFGDLPDHSIFWLQEGQSLPDCYFADKFIFEKIGEIAIVVAVFCDETSVMFVGTEYKVDPDTTVQVPARQDARQK